MPPDPDELLLQAETLASNPAATQADFRRAISAAYYAVFHFCLTAAADMICGSASRTSERYRLVYRSVDHGALARLCRQVNKSNPDVPVKPSSGLRVIEKFAGVAVNLQVHRQLADYDPLLTLTDVEANAEISDAREAIKWFHGSSEEQKEAFLTMLLFPENRRQ